MISKRSLRKEGIIDRIKSSLNQGPSLLLENPLQTKRLSSLTILLSKKEDSIKVTAPIKVTVYKTKDELGNWVFASRSCEQFAQSSLKYVPNKRDLNKKNLLEYFQIPLVFKNYLNNRKE